MTVVFPPPIAGAHVPDTVKFDSWTKFPFNESLCTNVEHVTMALLKITRQTATIAEMREFQMQNWVFKGLPCFSTARELFNPTRSRELTMYFPNDGGKG